MSAEFWSRSVLSVGGRPFSARHAALGALLALSACAHAPVEVTTTPAEERNLFVEANEDIIEYHIKDVRPDQLALDGLAILTTVDPALSIERDASQVILRQGKTVRRFKSPDPSEIAAWGTLTAEVLHTARTLSNDVAALPDDRLDEMVIDASLAQLDPFSRYARPEVAREHRAARDGFAGIGVTLDIRESDVRIASVLPDTPAAIAGLQAGDRIVELDGVSIAGLTPDDIRRHLRGAERTLVQIAIARNSADEPLRMTLERATIVPETVTLKEEAGIAWLKLRAFNQQTAQSLAALLRQAHSDMGPQLHGIVLDLRDNPGGLLDQSIDVASLFISGGDVISTVGRNPQSQQHFTTIADVDPETLPMAVLIDGGSASASEIVAAALQDSGRAVVIGTSSYGKGTVQNVLRTTNDGELTVTWAQIITRRGYKLNTHGVVPTLCTATIGDSPANLATLLAAGPGGVPATLATARLSLDDAGWNGLRKLCPPQRDKRALDHAVATQLLTDPALYRRALASMDAPRVAAKD
jgi:carboxyl-terminal processing protease